MLLEAAGLRKEYRTRDGAFVALDDVSLSVDAGEVVGLIGTSGSGKSTLGSLLVGLETADAGVMEFCGCSCDISLPARKRPAGFRSAMRGMQMVFQNPGSSFSPRMRIGTAVAEGVAYGGMPRHLCRQAALDALEQVGLPRSYAQRYAWELSGGECQRAALARAIIGKPRLLVCDEPTSALDVTVQAQIVGLIRGLCEELGMACLFISHDLALVHGLCTRAYVIETGSIVEQGSVEDLFARPQAAATKRLLAAVVTI